MQDQLLNLIIQQIAAGAEVAAVTKIHEEELNKHETLLREIDRRTIGILPREELVELVTTSAIAAAHTAVRDKINTRDKPLWKKVLESAILGGAASAATIAIAYFLGHMHVAFK